MWAANLQQVFNKNPQGARYTAWVLFVKHGAGTPREEAIRNKHQEIDAILFDQNVNFTEITTRVGKVQIYDKFGFRNGQHPIFLILNKPPVEYSKGDSLIAIEWGKWKDIDEMRDHVMALANLFSDEDFRGNLAKAKDKKTWKVVANFLGKHGITILKIGVTIAAAVA